MHFVYILRSEAQQDQIYIGFTSDVQARLADHNAGRSAHTSKFTPWALQFYCAFPDKQTALAFETYLKSHSGRAFASKRLLA